MRAAPLLHVITIMRWKWRGSLTTLVRRVCVAEASVSYTGRAGGGGGQEAGAVPAQGLADAHSHWA